MLPLAAPPSRKAEDGFSRLPPARAVTGKRLKRGTARLFGCIHRTGHFGGQEALTPRALPRTLFFLLVGALLAGCQVAAPPPVVEALPQVSNLPEPAPEPVPAPSQPQPEPVAEEPKSTVSVALLDSAGQLAASGRSEEAVETLERAIRIEPRRGDLWLRLARLQFNAGEFGQAEQNARKGLLFLSPGSDDARDAWLLVAAAREALGDLDEARSIRERWGVFQG